MNKNEKIAEEYGKATFEYAFVMDQDEEERRRGITINIAQANFKTETKNFNIIDAPGHKDFIGNMISGASQAGCAILCIESEANAFDHSFNMGSTKEHVILARSLGVV